ncbi:MAG TPA: RIP metalloprotease RseP [Burkholderiaceae bacterium]|nr:RIP metalloprotease RseP [Burkholderiaceae bacterium]
MDLITTILAFLLALGILIVVHELGHFWVARWCGVKVLRFSVGFGRPLYRWVRGADRTEWIIAAIPYGGYVKMLDENEADGTPVPAAELPRAFNRQPVGKRAAIVVAGPAANLLFAVLLYWAVNVIGTLEPLPVLGPPPQDSPAAEAGLQDGDQVLEFDGQRLRTWSDLRWALLRAGIAGKVANLTVRDLQGVERTLRLDLSSGRTEDVDDTWFERVGVVRGAGAPIVRGLVAGEVAAKAGLAVGDRIVSIDGVAVRSATEVTKRVRASAGRLQTWELERDGVLQRRTLTPAALTLSDGQTIGRVGVDFLELQSIRYPPVEALGRAASRTWDTSVFSLRMVWRMVEGRASWRNLSGPVSIADVAGQTARIGLVAYLSFLALVSISLGVLNLLPIPVLDGGHLLYYAVEIAKGSPPSVRTVELAQRVGIGMLILLTALALFNDLTRLLS